MKYIYRILFAAAMIGAVMLTGCNSFYTPGEPGEEPIEELPITHTISDLLSLATVTNPETGAVTYLKKVEITEDIVIGGKVVSSDYDGNFYRSFYIQDETGGIEIRVGTRTLYSTYSEGRMIYIKAKGLCLGDYGGMMSLGAVNDDPTTSYNNTHIDIKWVIRDKIKLGVYGDPVAPTVISTVEDMQKPENLGRLVTLKGAVRTGELGYSFYYDAAGVRHEITSIDTWAKPNDPNDENENAGYVSHIFSFGSSQFLIRTSGYSSFAPEKVDERVRVGEAADVTGILTRYSSNPGTYAYQYQLNLNRSRDVKRAQ